MDILRIFYSIYFYISIFCLFFMIIDFYNERKKIKLKEKELLEKAIKLLEEKELLE